MEAVEIIARLAHETSKRGRRFFNADGNRRLYTASCVDLVADALGGSDDRMVEEVRKEFYSFVTTGYGLNFGPLFNLRGNVEDDPQNNWHGSLVLPVFREGGLFFLQDNGLALSRQDYFRELARYSFRPNKDKLLQGLHSFGPEALFKNMARANPNYTTLTTVDASYDWINLLRDNVSVVRMGRLSQPTYVADLVSVVGEEGARMILDGDCLQTLMMYEVLLKEFYGKQDAVVEHAEKDFCEGLGNEGCSYVLMFEPSGNIAQLLFGAGLELAYSKVIEPVTRIFTGRNSSRDQILEYKAELRRLTEDLRLTNTALEDRTLALQEANDALEDKTKSLEAANLELDSANQALLDKYGALTKLYHQQIQLQDAWSGFRDGEIHDAKNDFIGVSSGIHLLRRHLLDYSCVTQGGFPRILGIHVLRNYPRIREEILGARLKNLELAGATQDEIQGEKDRRYTIDDFLSHLDTTRLDHVFSTVPLSGLDSNLKELYGHLRGDLSTVGHHVSVGKDALLRVLANVTPQQKLTQVDYVDFWEDLRSKISPHCRGLDLQIDIEDATLEVYPAQMDLAIINLLRNAVQAVTSTPEVLGYIHVRGHNAGELYRTVISNSGGDTTALAPRLNAGEVFSEREGGTSTGIPVARDIIRRHFGSINFRSIKSGGLEVVVDLPIRK